MLWHISESYNNLEENLTSYFTDKDTEIKDSATTLAAISWSTGTLIDAQRRLATFLMGVKDSFDLVLIDTQPDLSTYTLNALIASDYYLVPMQPERMSVNGFSLLSNTIQIVHSINPVLELLGVVCSQYDGRIASHKNRN